MKFNVDDLTLAAYVARATTLEPSRIGALLARLRRLSRRHHSAAERLCNDASFGAGRGEAVLSRIEAEAREIAGLLGLPWMINRDPRGAAFRFRLPDGRSNNMGGEDWSF